MYKFRRQSKNCRKKLKNKQLVCFLFFAVSLFFPQNITAKPLMSVVIDDVGGSLINCQKLIKIEHPLNIAVMPGTPYAQKCAVLINKSPHQLLIHFPWDGLGLRYKKYYPIRIMRGMSKEEMAQMISRAFASVPNAQGINNHMGSQFSASSEDVEKFMNILKKYKNNKYFLDSNTSRFSKAYFWARKYGIKTTKNNVFLDGKQTAEYIDRQFNYAVSLAKKEGTIVAICHGNRKVTLDNLPKLLKKYEEQVDFVYLPQLMEQRLNDEIKINYKKGI